MINYRVFRVEHRHDPDCVDFWDFLTREQADQWNNDELNLAGSVRELSEDEIIATALASYRQELLDPR